jgi:hypothetical protein
MAVALLVVALFSLVGGLLLLRADRRRRDHPPSPPTRFVPPQAPHRPVVPSPRPSAAPVPPRPPGETPSGPVDTASGAGGPAVEPVEAERPRDTVPAVELLLTALSGPDGDFLYVTRIGYRVPAGRIEQQRARLTGRDRPGGGPVVEASVRPAVEPAPGARTTPGLRARTAGPGRGARAVEPAPAPAVGCKEHVLAEAAGAAAARRWFDPAWQTATRTWRAPYQQGIDALTADLDSAGDALHGLLLGDPVGGLFEAAGLPGAPVFAAVAAELPLPVVNPLLGGTGRMLRVVGLGVGLLTGNALLMIASGKALLHDLTSELLVRQFVRLVTRTVRPPRTRVARAARAGQRLGVAPRAAAEVPARRIPGAKRVVAPRVRRERSAEVEPSTRLAVVQARRAARVRQLAAQRARAQERLTQRVGAIDAARRAREGATREQPAVRTAEQQEALRVEALHRQQAAARAAAVHMRA